MCMRKNQTPRWQRRQLPIDVRFTYVRVNPHVLASCLVLVGLFLSFLHSKPFNCFVIKGSDDLFWSISIPYAHCYSPRFLDPLIGSFWNVIIFGRPKLDWGVMLLYGILYMYMVLNWIWLYFSSNFNFLIFVF